MNIFPALCLTIATTGATLVAQIPPAADAPQPLPPAESKARMQLPPGFEIDLIASEPLITEPSGICWDAHGRLFVCELHGYNIEGHLDTVALNKTGKLDKTVRRIRWELQGGEIAEQAAKQQWGVLKLLQDTDGDGVMDQAEVWAEDLPPCYGVEAVNGGVLVTCAPDIVFFADRDLDGRPEIRETLYTGFDIRVLEREINSPRLGLDNWIYVGSGGDGGTITGPRLKEPVRLGNSDFRIKTDGTAIEPVTGSVGTFGLTMNAIGDRFPSSGGRPAVYALPIPYHYLRQNPHVPTPPGNHTASHYDNGYRLSDPHPWRVKRASDPEWVDFYGKHETTSIYFSGGCSTTYYGDALFPQPYHGNLFYCEPSLNIIHRCLLKREGAGYRAERAPEEQQSEFLASTDQWFRPMALRVSPGGALTIVDMYREIIEDYSAIPRFLQQQYGLDQGKAHGRLWRLAPKGTAHEAPPALANASNRDLVPMLDHESAWHRRTAQAVLIERQAEGIVPALEQLLTTGETSSLGLLHTLYTLQGLQSLANKHVRPLFHHEDYRVRVHALRLVVPEGFNARSDNRSLAASIVKRLNEDNDPSVRIQAALTLGTFHDAPFARMIPAALHPEKDEPWLVAAILSSSNHAHASTLLQAALAEPRSMPLLEGLATTMASRCDDVSSTLAQVTEANSTAAHAVLTGFQQAKQPLTLSEQGQAHLRNLATHHEDPNIQDLAMALALQLPEMELGEVFDRALDAARDDSLPLAARVKALERAAYAPYDQLEPAATAFLHAKAAPALQHAALQALGKSDDPRVGQTLLNQWAAIGPQARPRLLAILLEHSNRAPTLLEALQAGTLKARDLTEVQREQLIKTLPSAKPFFSDLESEPALQARLQRYGDALTSPVDLQLGEALFRQTCLTCHRLGEEGTDIGPALGSLTAQPDASILTEILDPAGKIDPEYTLYLITLQNGESLAGVIPSESPTSLTLRQADGKQKAILRNEIATITSADASLMPANLHEVISPEAMPSLLAFIRKAYGVQKP